MRRDETLLSNKWGKYKQQTTNNNMTLKELVMDTVAKTPDFNVAGEIADLLYSRVEQVSGADTAYMAADMYLAEINKRFHTNYRMKK